MTVPLTRLGVEIHRYVPQTYAHLVIPFHPQFLAIVLLLLLALQLVHIYLHFCNHEDRISCLADP